MYDYLVNRGIDKNKLIKEDQSLSTVQNAKYSVPIAKKLGANKVIVCSSAYHFAEDYPYNARKPFTSELEGSGIELVIYCE